MKHRRQQFDAETRRRVYESGRRYAFGWDQHRPPAARQKDEDMADSRIIHAGGRIVVVCGGRDYGDKQHVVATLDGLHANLPFRLLLEGGADGADYYARRWAAWRGVPRLTIRAEWGKFRKAAGPKRNREMLDAEPDLVVAFPGGPGTADMVSACNERNVDVIVIENRKVG